MGEKNSGEENSSRRVRAPGDKVLTVQFQRSEQFWLLIGARKSLFFSAQSQSSNTRSHFVFSYTKYTYPPVTRHKLTEGLLEEKSPKYSTKCRGNPKETRRKYAGPFAGIVLLVYLKDREFVYSQMSIDKFFRRFGISLILDEVDFSPISTSYFNCCA